MPNVNPPVDAEQAERSPELVFSGSAGPVVRIGQRREASTLPLPTVFRFVIADIGGERFTGYLWRA